MRTLPKAYLRVDPNLAFTHPDPGAFIRLLCLANAQPTRGRFKEWGLLEAGLGAAAAEKLKARGDIVEADGRWYVAGWDEWQEGDVTVAERQKRIRERRYSPVTPPLSGSDPAVDPRNTDVRALGREDVRPSDSPPLDRVAQVFDHWRAVMGHHEAKLTPERRKRIESRLRDGYSPLSLMEAVDGCRASAFHMGANEGGRRYDDLMLILRTGSKVEEFRQLRPKPREPVAEQRSPCLDWIAARGGAMAVAEAVVATGKPEREALAEMGAPVGTLAAINVAIYTARKQARQAQATA